jgi:hypothetical protein
VGRKPKEAGLSIEEMVGRYRAGETCRAIAAAARLSRSAVHNRLRRAGVELRWGGEARRYERLDLPVGRIIERYRAGETTTAIGRSLGVSDEVVRRRLIRAAVERRRPGSEKGGQSS